MQFPYDEFTLDPDKDKDLYDLFRQKGYGSFPVVYLYQDGVKVDEWNNLSFQKIDHWNALYKKEVN